uniref:Uncharacterized protein n=1 Tax=Tetranychus urticae TaxID=32264 RepID=T1KYG5_TETUR
MFLHVINIFKAFQLLYLAHQHEWNRENQMLDLTVCIQSNINNVKEEAKRWRRKYTLKGERN